MTAGALVVVTVLWVLLIRPSDPDPTLTFHDKISTFRKRSNLP